MEESGSVEAICEQILKDANEKAEQLILGASKSIQELDEKLNVEIEQARSDIMKKADLEVAIIKKRNTARLNIELNRIRFGRIEKQIEAIMELMKDKIKTMIGGVKLMSLAREAALGISEQVVILAAQIK
jgi:vacuolar-type H+-ATPase subunit E/Vma4